MNKSLYTKEPPVTDQEKREASDQYMDWRFPDLKKLADLRTLLSEEQQKLLRFEGANASEEGLSRIRGWIAELEAKIETLLATGDFPAPSK